MQHTREAPMSLNSRRSFQMELPEFLIPALE
jgi:hypothetical protein